MGIYLSSSIEQLNLPRRHYNALRRAGICTVEQFLDLSEDELLDMRNLGEKSAQEIQMIQKNILCEGIGPEPVQTEASVPPRAEMAEPPLATRVDIDLLKLSVRANNRLRSAGICLVSDLFAVTRDELLKIPKLGEKLATEILDARDKYTEQFPEYSHNAPEMGLDTTCCDDSSKVLIEDIYKMLSAELGSLSPKLLAEISKLVIELNTTASSTPLTLESEFVWGALYNAPETRTGIKTKICYVLKETPDGIKEETLLSALSRFPYIEKYSDILISELMESHAIIYAGDLIQYRFQSIVDYAKEVANERTYNILIARLQGKTLQEVGELYGLQRERVRQITAKVLKRHPRVWEDRYAKVFQKYDIDEKAFIFAFKESGISYHYLNLVYSRGRYDVDELYADEDFPGWIRQAGGRFRMLSCVELEDGFVHCDRISLVEYLIRKVALDDITYGKFSELYNAMLENLGLANNLKLSLSERGYENKIARSHHILWKWGQRFRYYDMGAYDFDNFLEQLHLSQYSDMEISTLKIFRDFPELMREYDIRDEYELHNLLKKICRADAYPDLSFGRMPTIQFGDADRETQVTDLLFSIAPIEREKFAELYEEEYGVKSQTVLANYVDHITCYLQDDVYKVDVDELPENIMEELRENLPDPFYTISDITNIYKKLYPQEDLPRINHFTLDRLGFHVYTSYVISKQYSSAVDYFRSVLDSSDLVDLRQYDTKLTTLLAFTSVMYKERATYDIVEFHPQRYISINRLNKNGVDKNDILDYCDKVAGVISEGTYFTIYSLRNNGFEHRLDTLGFDDWFYASLLAEDKERFSYRRITGTRLFRRGCCEVTLTGLIEDILFSKDNLSMDIGDLRDELRDVYGIQRPVYKLTEMIKESSMYYDIITEKVYAEYDVYFEQI